MRRQGIWLGLSLFLTMAWWVQPVPAAQKPARSIVSATSAAPR